MPIATRRLARLNADRAVLTIPPRNDTSLFQKRGNCIEGLPLSIFQVIQEYSDPADYRSLVNSNLSTFQPIKYETINYVLTGPEGWNGVDSCAVEKKEAYLMNIINSVKDKSKQISVRFREVNHETIRQYSHLFEGIHSLSIKCRKLRKADKVDFPLELMKNMDDIQLVDVVGIPVLKRGFDNVMKLNIMNVDVQRIEEINSMKTLKVLAVNSCEKLNSISGCDDIPVISIIRCLRLTKISLPKNCQEFRCLHGLLPSLQGDLQIFGRSLQKLYLRGVFDIKIINFSFCQNISVVSLQNDGLFLDFIPPFFPVFHGEYLFLSGFNLSSWNGQILENAKKIQLVSCSDLVRLPEMPQVLILSLSQCGNLKSIPSLNCLTALFMFECCTCESISFCLSLQTVKIVSCAKLTDISPGPRLKTLVVQECKRFHDTTSFAAVKDLTLDDNPGISSLEGIQGNEQDYQVLERNVKLVFLKYVKNFHYCKNIYQLELSHCLGLATCQGIANIHHLTIKNCESLMNTAGLQNITGSLILERCSSLTALIGLQGIPKVYLNNCAEIESFQGLGNHKTLHVSEVPKFLPIFKEFKQSGTHQEILGNIDGFDVNTRLKPVPAGSTARMSVKSYAFSEKDLIF
jgi:hypothetical protein